jgi:hypothetical protein
VASSSPGRGATRTVWFHSQMTREPCARGQQQQQVAIVHMQLMMHGHTKVGTANQVAGGAAGMPPFLLPPHRLLRALGPTCWGATLAMCSGPSLNRVLSMSWSVRIQLPSATLSPARRALHSSSSWWGERGGQQGGRREGRQQGEAVGSCGGGLAGCVGQPT